MKCDGTRAETRFRLSAKRTSPFKSARGRQFSRLLAAELCAISGSNAGYTMFRGSVKGTGYPLHSPVSPFTSPTLASPCAITFQLESNTLFSYTRKHILLAFDLVFCVCVCVGPDVHLQVFESPDAGRRSSVFTTSGGLLSFGSK